MKVRTHNTLAVVKSFLCHLAIAGAAIGGVVAMQRAQLMQPSLWVEHPQQAAEQEQLRLTLLSHSPDFGWNNLIADWTFLNFLQYDGDDTARQQTGYGLSPKYFDLITQRDPRFVQIYPFMVGSISYQLGQPQVSLSYLKRGTDALSPRMTPEAFSLWRLASLDQLLLLGDLPGATHSLEMAGWWAGQTSMYRSLEPIFQRSAAFLRSNPDSRLVRFQGWSVVYRQASEVGDRKAQARARQEILALGAIEHTNDRGEVSFRLPAGVAVPTPEPTPQASQPTVSDP